MIERKLGQVNERSRGIEEWDGEAIGGFGMANVLHILSELFEVESWHQGIHDRDG